MTPLRAAVIERTRHSRFTLREVLRYMPATQNYWAAEETDGSIRIVGRDFHGWGLDSYIIPRLASGMIYAVECEPTAEEIRSDSYRRFNP